MKLVSYGPFRKESPGLFLPDKGIMPLAPLLRRSGFKDMGISDILADWTLVGPLIENAITESHDWIAPESVRLGSPIPFPGKVVAIGFNYLAHAAEVTGVPTPDEAVPIVFLKPSTSVCGPNDAIIKPPETSALDYEVELGIVIGKPAHRVAREFAHDYVAGYVLANDVTARDIALGLGLDQPMHLQVARGKGFASFCPLGPWLVTADELPENPSFELTLTVNGEERQHGSTSDMVTDVAGLVEFVSASMELLPGDVILTGTPPGCGFQMHPPQFLTAGDRVEITGSRLGSAATTVVDEILTNSP